MLDELGRVPCWLDGAVRVRLEPRRLTQPQPWLDALARPDRPRLVEALAVYFDPDTSPEEVMAFQAMAGVLTPTRCPVGAVRADAEAAGGVAGVVSGEAVRR